MRFKAHVVDYMSSVDLLMYSPNDSGGIALIVKPITIEVEELPDTKYVRAPSMSLDIQAAQSLLDALTEAGMRPTKLANPSGEIARINDHLQDMRKLVFESGNNAVLVSTLQRFMENAK